MRSGVIDKEEISHSGFQLLMLYSQLDVLFKHTFELFSGSVGS